MHPSSVCPSVRSPLIHSLARVTFACPAASWHRPGRAPAPGREGAPLPPVQQRDGAPARMLQGQAGDGVSAPAPTRPRWGALGPTPGAAPCLCLAHPRWGLGRSPPPPREQVQNTVGFPTEPRAASPWEPRFSPKCPRPSQIGVLLPPGAWPGHQAAGDLGGVPPGWDRGRFGPSVHPALISGGLPSARPQDCKVLLGGPCSDPVGPAAGALPICPPAGRGGRAGRLEPSNLTPRPAPGPVRPLEGRTS